MTGLLIAHRGWFLQALEGPADDVHDLFRHICTDPRHCDAELLAEAPPRHASLVAGTCARGSSPTDALILGELDRRPAFEPADFPERVVMRLLKAVASTHEQALTKQQDLVPAQIPPRLT
ncbi:MAG TPA: BLUF domain-containing protein [Phenylobacterium sp.]|nr:BLUF domain-containing protein [Phenylobacterium sp.]